MVTLKERYSAVLMSVSSLPNEFGIGGFGEEAERFLDFVKFSGFSAWQVLPFNLPDLGNSPYGSSSAFAGNYLYIDPKRLVNEGWLSDDEFEALKYTGSVYTVDYNFVYASKKRMLVMAFNKALPTVKEQLDLFSNKNKWVLDYALYMVLKNKNNGAPWQSWNESERDYKKAYKNINKYKEQMQFYIFEQFVFARQYNAVKEYAENLGIAIIGDIPIYVALDSVDVWKDPNLFKLDQNYKPLEVAGVPPDAFSEDGQLWGNPIYDWKQHEKTGFKWWISRLCRTFELYDRVRIDHFRGFASYYSVDAKASDAKNGNWNEGPRLKLFNEVLKRFPKERIIAEDLGTYSPDVEKLLSDTGIKGMRVVQFAFDGNNSTHLPHNCDKNCVAYIGTHDNNTLIGWLWEIDDNTRKRTLNYCGFSGENWGQGGFYSSSARAIIETVWKSAAAAAVIPFQDMCGFGADTRMNIPGVPKNNWRFRTTFDTINSVDKDYFKFINYLYFR